MLKTFAIIGGVVFLLVFVIITVPFPKGRYIDCSVAEISPDFTSEMRETCRELRGRIRATKM